MLPFGPAGPVEPVLNLLIQYYLLVLVVLYHPLIRYYLLVQMVLVFLVFLENLDYQYYL